MKRQHWGFYAVALAILVVGLVWAGVPASTLLIGALVLVCPLMMLFMHGNGGHGGHGQPPQRQEHLHAGSHHDEHRTERQDLRR